MSSVNLFDDDEFDELPEDYLVNVTKEDVYGWLDAWGMSGWYLSGHDLENMISIGPIPEPVLMQDVEGDAIAVTVDFSKIEDSDPKDFDVMWGIEFGSDLIHAMAVRGMTRIASIPGRLANGPVKAHPYTFYFITKAQAKELANMWEVDSIVHEMLDGTRAAEE